MDPLVQDGMNSFHYTKIEDELIFNYLDMISPKWVYFHSAHDLQSDSTSCGILVMKYIFLLNENVRIQNLSVKECRHYFIKLLIQSGFINEAICAYCAKRNPVGVKKDTIDWIKCDS